MPFPSRSLVSPTSNGRQAGARPTDVITKEMVASFAEKAGPLPSASQPVLKTVQA
jgi:hypothetical protein